MADNRVKASSRLIGAGTTYIPQRGLIDGTAFTADWLARMAFEGRMFTVHAGTGTAPITSAGAYVNTTPDLDMSVPSGVMCIPIALTVQFETFGTILLTEVIAAIGKGGVITPTATEATVITNHRLDYTGAPSGITAVSTGTGATYMTANVLEFFRDGHQGDVTVSALATGNQASNLAKFRWSALEQGNWPIMYATDGITRCNVHMSSQAGTGFIALTCVVPPLNGD
jgi:hypothetical protein